MPKIVQPQLPQQPPLPDAGSSPSAEPDAEFLASTAGFAATVDDGFQPLAAQPAAAPADQAIPPELVAQALRPTFQSLFHAIASNRGAHWELKEFETNALVQGWTPIVQVLLAKLGNSEQVLLALALTSTVGIVGGKIALDATKRASSMASTRTPASVASSASSASAIPASPPSPAGEFQEPDEL